MTGRASPKYGKVSAAVRNLSAHGIDAETILHRLSPRYGAKTVYSALTRARAAGAAPVRPKKHPGIFVINLSGAAGRRLADRAEIEGMTPAQLAKVILHRASRTLDTLEIHS